MGVIEGISNNMRKETRVINTVVKEVVGEEVMPIVTLLKGNGGLSEFELAKKIDKDVNETRNLLYRLYEVNLVNFKKKREKKSGWYTYYWTFNSGMIKHLLKNLKKQRLIRLKNALKREKGTQFFSCKSRCVRLDFETATNFKFKCPECGGITYLDDNSYRIKVLKTLIKEHEGVI